MERLGVMMVTTSLAPPEGESLLKARQLGPVRIRHHGLRVGHANRRAMAPAVRFMISTAPGGAPVSGAVGTAAYPTSGGREHDACRCPRAAARSRDGFLYCVDDFHVVPAGSNASNVDLVKKGPSDRESSPR